MEEYQKETTRILIAILIVGVFLFALTL